jgi:hypothetical protein
MCRTPLGIAYTDLRFRSSAEARRCKSGHPSGAPILKPCKLAVEPVCADRATADGRGADASHEDRLHGALGKDSVGTYRKDD